ncbi:MAG TPA: SRPBCC family protein [Ignavibacteria bacterium]|jgi:uncharacterized protein YndB with AHSA1/START domain|nr:SRPBCC family protein [Ignavibacteria bacterium]
MQREKITIEAVIKADVNKVWEMWNQPEHITKWNQASDDWHSPSSENNLRTGGKFKTRMEAKDGSMGFDFGGTYDEVVTNEIIRYTMDDGRQVSVKFAQEGDLTRVTETFEAESANSVEMQRTGWQAILDNFKKYAES